MNCRYTDEELKEDVERTIGIRAKDIEKIQFCGLWHIRFRAFGSDFYYYRANSDDTAFGWVPSRFMRKIICRLG